MGEIDLLDMSVHVTDLEELFLRWRDPVDEIWTSDSKTYAT